LNNTLIWCKALLTKGGFAHLFGIFVKANIKELLSEQLPQQCLFLMLKLLYHFLTGIGGVDKKEAFAAIDASALSLKLTQFMAVSMEILDVANAWVKRARPQNRRTAYHQQPQEEWVLTDEARMHADIIRYDLFLLAEILRDIPANWDIVRKYEGWPNALETGFTKNRNSAVRNQFKEGLVQVCVRLNDVPGISLNPRIFFLSKALDVIPSLTHNSFCVEYFDFIILLLRNSRPDDGSHQPKKLAEYLMKAIKGHPIVENALRHNVDELLCGLLQLTAHLVSQNPDLKDAMGAKGGLLEDVMHCLFDMPTEEFQRAARDIEKPPKAKTPKTRRMAFSLLAELAKSHEANTRSLLSMVAANHDKPHSGGAKPHEWLFEARNEEKSPTGYAGLVNLGCICYMNACHQQLYMIPQLRRNLLAMDTSKEEDLKESLLYQTQRLLSSLQETEKQSANPKDFCWTFKDFDGKPVNVTIQEDSCGYLTRLIDKVHELNKKLKDKEAFKDVMGGTFSHELIGRGECSHYREREEEFYAVQLEIKNKHNLQASLAQFVEGEMLAGSNQYRCSECNKKVDTLRRTSLKILPSTIALAFKRFALDFVTFQTTKLNDKMTFPDNLNLKPYTKEGLAWAEYNAIIKEGKKAKAPEVELKDESYYEYTLRGVIVHMGTATAGHYYSYIKENPSQQNSRWFEFNDTVVREFDPSQLAAECFGGVESSGSNNGSKYGGYGSGGGTTERSRNAYILFYDRKPESKDGKVAECKSADRFEVSNKNIAQEIWRDNLLFWKDKAMYDVHYFDFLWNLVDWIPIAEQKEAKLELPPEPEKYSLHQAVTELATRFVLMTLSRALHKDSLPRWAELLNKLYKGNVSMSIWLLQQLCSTETHWNRDFLLACKDSLSRSSVSELITQALSTIAALEQKSFETSPPKKEEKDEKESKESKDSKDKEKEKPVAADWSRGFVVGYIDQLIPILRTAVPYWRTFDNYFKILAHIAGLGVPEAQYLLKHDLIAKLLDFYLGDNSTHPEVNGIALNSKGKRDVMGSQYEAANLTSFLQCLRNLILISESPYWPKGAKPPYLKEKEPVPLSAAAADLIQSKAFLKTIIAEANTRKKGESIVAIINHHCFESKELSQKVISAISSELEEKPYDKCRCYIRVLNGLLNLEDSLQDDRVEWVISSFLAVMESQKKYWKFTDFCIDHLIRMTKSSRKTYAWLQGHADRIDWVIQWVKEHATPPVMDESMELYKPNYKASGGWASKSESAAPTGLPPARKELALLIIKEGKVLDSDDAGDSDQALEDREFKVGQYVDVRDTANDWLIGKVVQVAGNRVKITYVGWPASWDEWLDKSESRLMELGKYTTAQQRAKAGLNKNGVEAQQQGVVQQSQVITIAP